MGTGKGEPDYWCAVVKPGTVMFELGRRARGRARARRFNKVAHKLPDQDAARAAEARR